MNAIDALRHFFERQLASPNDLAQHLGLSEEISSEHLISYLVDQTVRRAATDAAMHRLSVGGPAGRSPAEVSWKHCLMVAALTELRSIKMSAGSRI